MLQQVTDRNPTLYMNTRDTFYAINKSVPLLIGNVKKSEETGQLLLPETVVWGFCALTFYFTTNTSQKAPTV